MYKWHFSLMLKYMVNGAECSSRIPGSLWVVAALEPQLSRRKGILLILLMRLMVRVVV